MRIGPWHWAGAAVLSLAAHAALLAGVGPLDRPAEQRAHGTPAVTWGVVARSLDEAEPTNAVSDGMPDGAEAPDRLAKIPDGADAEQAVAAEAAEPAPVEPPLRVEPLVEPQAESLAAPAPAEREHDTAGAMTPPERKPQIEPARQPAPRHAARTPSGPVGEAAGETAAPADTAGRAEVSAYSGLVLAHLRRQKRYPPAARRAGLQGTARLTFVLGAGGQVRAARISGRSGHAVLDREALAMVRRAAPFPPIPPALRRSDMTFTVPIRFTR